ncbi:MAG: sensor domain-containing diguanylate cyclase, partial [Bacillota bacterium]|nr:sensor domain-containing diguanylate cyclase [Bacillota bacterium]
NNEVSFCEVNSPWGYTLQWKGDYEESARKLLEVVNTYKKIGSYIDLITSYHAFTSTLLIWGELSQAKIYIDEFLIFAQRLGGAYVISLSTFMNSWYHLVKGNIDQSLDAALESCKIAEGKELLLECIESAMIARLYLAKGNLEKGFEYIERSKRLNETNKFLYMYTNLLYIVKAELYISKFASLRDRLTKKEISALEKKVKKALRIANAKTKNLPHFIGNFLRVKAGYFAVIGSYKEAEKSFCKSIENCIRYKLKYDLAIGYYEFGLFLQKINRYDEARNNIEKSYNLFKEMSSEFYIKLCENFLGISGKEASDSTERFSQLIRTSQRMSSIVLISQKISSILDLDELLNKIMDSVIEVTGAQNACLMLIDKKTGIMKNVVSKSSDGSTVEGMQVSQNIIHKVLEKGEAVISTNAMEDERYSTMQSVVLNRLKSVLCIPIKYNDEINGVCYLDNQLSSSVFSEEDVQTLNVFMTQAAISIANAELYRMAITDGLTELITHKHFQTLLDNELERSNRYGRSFSLIMLDIDNFKKFNDTYGHQAGDQVLIHVARALKETFRNVDIVARYGGEEFAAILPETQVNSAKIAGERVRKAIENTEVIYDGMKLKVTVSIGISMFPDYAADPTSLINTADKALYRSKENGRNMVTVYQDLLLFI